MIEYQFRTLARWPRKETPSHTRRRSPFKSTLGRTYEDLRGELEAIGAKGVVWIEAGFERKHIRADGLPYSNAPKPSHPGVIVYAPETKKGPLRFCCDDCWLWEHNLRAIVLTMERLRLADIYGVTKDAEQYKGFAALPPAVPGEFATAKEAAQWCGVEDEWIEVPGVLMEAGPAWDACYRRLAKKFHPDAGGDGVGWAKLQKARELIEAVHAGRR